MKKKIKYTIIILFLLSIIAIPTLCKYTSTYSITLKLSARQPEYDVEYVPNIYNLPDEYTELEYIESTGTQYIITNIIPTDTTGVSITLENLDNPNEEIYFGSGNSENIDGYWIGDTVKVPYYRWDALYSNGGSGVSTGGARISRIDLPDGEASNLQLNFKNDRKLKYNNDTYYSSLPTLKEKILPIAIFGENNDYYNEVSYLAEIKLFNLVVTDADVIIANFIPCYRNSDGKAGLYDIVNNVFYDNDGTGEFIKGNVIEHFAYGTPKQLFESDRYHYSEHYISSWNTMIDGTGTSYAENEVADKITQVDKSLVKLYAQWEIYGTTFNFYPNRLAPGYTELEYIEGTGNQYIFTDIIPDNETGVYAKIVNTDPYYNRVYFGSAKTEDEIGLLAGASTNRAYFRWNTLHSSGSGDLRITINATTPNSYKLNYLNDRIFSFNDTPYIYDLPVLKNIINPMAIFGYYSETNNGISKISKMKLYEFVITQDNEIIRNYIPCYSENDKKVGLYETITGVFYPSESSNDFIAGPEIKATQKINYNTSERLIPNSFTKDGYSYAYWNTSPDGTGTTYSDNELFENTDSNITQINLYAIWVPSS